MIAMRPPLLPVVSLFALLVAGCPTPTQYGGPIAVDTDGFAARMAWLCHWGVHGGQDQACFDPHAGEKESAARDQPDAATPAMARPVAAERSKAEPTPTPADKPASTDAGAPEARVRDEGDAGGPEPNTEAGVETKPEKPEGDDVVPPEEPSWPPESPEGQNVKR